jgi:hypothetical protein
MKTCSGRNDRLTSRDVQDIISLMFAKHFSNVNINANNNISNNLIDALINANQGASSDTFKSILDQLLLNQSEYI